MQLAHSRGHLYRTAISSLVQTTIGNTGGMEEASVGVTVFADHNFIDESAEGALFEYLEKEFVSLVSFTASFTDREDQPAQRLILLLANEDQLAVAFVEPEDIDAYLADGGDVEFEYGKNLFAYDALEIGFVAKVIREFTLAGINPDGNRGILKEDSNEESAND